MAWYTDPLTYVLPVAKLGEEAGLLGKGGLTDDQKKQQDLLRQQAAAAGGFADYGEGGFKSLGTQADTSRQMLMDQATGKLSYSREALRQGLQQNLAGQQAYAASAMPNNAAMASFNAARNMARMGSGLSGQQALAGIAEQQAAQKALADQILQQRQQELQAALGSRGNAVNALGVQFQAAPSTMDKLIAGASQFGAAAATKSDKRLKTEISDGDERARKALQELGAYRFKYKDPKHGAGEQFGVMAQDMERAGLGHAVIDEPDGKAVHGAKAATAALALLAHMGKRVSKLEGKK
jgi:hypothetical protein